MKPTSRTRKPRAVKEECTRLHSKIVRALNPWCENECGRASTDAAHIIGRKYSLTRTDTDNAYGLCAQCHALFTNNHGLWMDFVDRTIGRDEYNRLWVKANGGGKVDWFDECDRLRAFAEQIGVTA